MHAADSPSMNDTKNFGLLLVVFHSHGYGYLALKH